jgi:CubicO group peptidase (beta-lactamase class C family)
MYSMRVEGEMGRYWRTKDTKMFSGQLQADNFRQMASIFPARVVRRSSRPQPLVKEKSRALPQLFEFNGVSLDTEAFLNSVDTTGLIVIKDECVVYENYWHGYDETTHAISWSVGKSFVSALMGVAIDEGAVRSIDDPVTQYAPELKGSAYDGVKLKDILQMSSGARWNEDYSDPNSDLNQFGRVRVQGGSVDAYCARTQREHPPGTFNRYNTLDTCVLGLLLRQATERSLSDYLHEKLWEPLGMQADCYWNIDSEGIEYAGGGLNAVLRDYAKLGLLYLHGGSWNDTQLISAEWVRASVTPDAPHLMPGKRPSAASPLGYGYQWWIPDNTGAYSAIGIYNQFIYINPSARMVIAKTSAFRDFARSSKPEHSRTAEHLALFRDMAIAM